MEVFILHHVHEMDDEEDVKLIGIYSTHANAEAAIMRLAQKPGFIDTPEGFEITAYTLDNDQWTDGYVTVSPYEEDDDEAEE